MLNNDPFLLPTEKGYSGSSVPNPLPDAPVWDPAGETEDGVHQRFRDLCPVLRGQGVQKQLPKLRHREDKCIDRGCFFSRKHRRPGKCLREGRASTTKLKALPVSYNEQFHHTCSRAEPFPGNFLWHLFVSRWVHSHTRAYVWTSSPY